MKLNNSIRILTDQEVNTKHEIKDAETKRKTLNITLGSFKADFHHKIIKDSGIQRMELIFKILQLLAFADNIRHNKNNRKRSERGIYNIENSIKKYGTKYQFTETKFTITNARKVKVPEHLIISVTSKVLKKLKLSITRINELRNEIYRVII